MIKGDMWRGEAMIIRHSVKAILVNHENEEQWIPNSQIHDDSEIWEKSTIGETGSLVIPLWLAEKKGWA